MTLLQVVLVSSFNPFKLERTEMFKVKFTTLHKLTLGLLYHHIMTETDLISNDVRLKQ